MKKKVLISGITGQDGVFLVNHLLKNDDYHIVGTSRVGSSPTFEKKLMHLGLNPNNIENLNVVKCNLSDPADIDGLLESFKPDYIYNLIGPGSVSESVKNPFDNSISILSSFNNLVNSIIKTKSFPNFFQTSSSEMFKNSEDGLLDENSSYLPQTPYAISKLYCHNMSDFYRNKYEWNISCGILFNHESEFRGNQYLLTKIINEAIKIHKGQSDSLTIGSIDLIRDWGFAGDIVEAMTLINENDKFEDFVIGTGQGHSIEDMLKIIFNYFNLEFEDFVKVDNRFMRKNEPLSIISNPKKIENQLGWVSSTSFEETILRSIQYRL
jgi:GDPmannose 4,6-dehydratase